MLDAYGLIMIKVYGRKHDNIHGDTSASWKYIVSK